VHNVSAVLDIVSSPELDQCHWKSRT